MPLLLRLLRGESVGNEVGETEWGLALSLAEEHHLLPWIARRALQGEVSPDLRNRLLGIKREAEIDSFYLSTELMRLMQAFEAAELIVVPLKGPFLGERLMGNAALRLSYDLDMLVAEDDLTRAEDVLRGMEFIPGQVDDYHRQWHRGGITLELHHDVDNPLTFEFCTADVLGRLERDAFAGQMCWRLAPDDELYYLCLHAARHRFERLSIVLDLCLGFEKLAGEAPDAGTGKGDQQQLLCLGLGVARRLNPGLNTELKRVPAATKRHMAKIADQLWMELVTRASEPLDWQRLHAFYVEVEPPERRVGRRWKHLRIALGRVVPQDVEFAARLGLRRRWQVQLLRPVRLVHDKVLTRRVTGGKT